MPFALGIALQVFKKKRKPKVNYESIIVMVHIVKYSPWRNSCKTMLYFDWAKVLLKACLLEKGKKYNRIF
jgi:hypothetical protein